MVDVWTGEEIFDFSYPMSMTGVAAADPRRALRYPVPATVAMVQWGRGARSTASFANEGYFDTATFGDAGGQLWVLRFNDPAILDASTKLATNWFGGRVFQMGGKGSTLLCTNEPFFYITANVSLPTDGTLRVLAGTGDRYNLLDQYGGTCGPDNIRACLQRGCTVTEVATSNSTTSPGVGNRQSGLSASNCTALTGTDALTSSASCPIVGNTKVAITSCPGSGSTARATTKDLQFTCTSATGGGGCVSTAAAPTAGTVLQLDDSSNVLTQLNKYYSVRVFELTGSRSVFATQAQAAAYDVARLTDSDLVAIDGASTNPTTLSDASGNGWVLSFNNAPTVSIAEVDYSVSRPDERVSSTSAVAANCTFWNTTQTVSAAAGRVGGNCFVSNCKQLNRRIHYLYGADVTTGGLCGLTDPVTLLPIRATKAVALVPPPAPQYTIFVNQKGQVQVGLTSVNTEIGAKNIQQGQAVDPATVLEMLDVPRSLHDCRHSDPAGASPTNCR